MKKRSVIFIATSLVVSLQGYGQKTQMKVAQNTVGKLQLAISKGQDKNTQMNIIGEGLKATTNATKDRRTKNWPESWAIAAYLNSYMSVLDGNEANSDKYYTSAVQALDSAKRLDRFENSRQLLDAANYNIILKKQQKGNNAYKSNDFQTSFSLLKEVSDVFHTDTTLAINTAISAQHINDYNNALTYFKRAQQNGAGNPALFQSIASIHTSKFENDLAIRALEQGLDRNPFNTFLNNDYINLLIDDEQFDKALRVIEKTLAVDNNNKLLLFLYGYLYQQKDQYSTAELAYQRALKIDPNYFDALFQLGLTYVEMGNVALAQNTTSKLDAFTSNIGRAETALLQAHEINPNDKQTVQLLIDIYARKNRLDKVQELKRKLEEF